MVIGSKAQVTVVNSSPTEGVAPVFGVELSNDRRVLPTQVGDRWTFDLGAVKQGSTVNPDTVSLAVVNLAGSGADNLSGTVSIRDGALLTGLAPSFADLAPGGVFDVANVASTTTTAGVESETFTITPADTNSTGYAAALPTQTVTITEIVVPLAKATCRQIASILVWFEAALSSQNFAVTNTGPAGAEALTQASAPSQAPAPAPARSACFRSASRLQPFQ